jgi:hypothetical protein
MAGNKRCYSIGSGYVIQDGCWWLYVVISVADCNLKVAMASHRDNDILPRSRLWDVQETLAHPKLELRTLSR